MLKSLSYSTRDFFKAIRSPFCVSFHHFLWLARVSFLSPFLSIDPRVRSALFFSDSLHFPYSLAPSDRREGMAKWERDCSLFYSSPSLHHLSSPWSLTEGVISPYCILSNRSEKRESMGNEESPVATNHSPLCKKQRVISAELPILLSLISPFPLPFLSLRNDQILSISHAILPHWLARDNAERRDENASLPRAMEWIKECPYRHTYRSIAGHHPMGERLLRERREERERETGKEDLGDSVSRE